MARSDGEPKPAGEPLIWEHSESTRVLFVGRNFKAISRAAAKLDLPLRRWNGIVSPEAPEEWPAIYARVDVVLAPSTTGAVAEGDGDE